MNATTLPASLDFEGITLSITDQDGRPWLTLTEIPLISKVKDSRLYRLTPRGVKAMGSAVRFRRADFPEYHRDIDAAIVQLAV